MVGGGEVVVTGGTHIFVPSGGRGLGGGRVLLDKPKPLLFQTNFKRWML